MKKISLLTTSFPRWLIIICLYGQLAEVERNKAYLYTGDIYKYVSHIESKLRHECFSQKNKPQHKAYTPFSDCLPYNRTRD